MRYYEMLFIVHPNYEQDRLDEVVTAVEKEIIAKGGKVLKTDNWGKRKLAYLINKQRYGTYVLMYFEADPLVISDLYEWMEINAQVLHQLVIRLEEEPELSEESENPDSYQASARPVKEVGKPRETDRDEEEEDDSDKEDADEDEDDEELTEEQ